MRLYPLNAPRTVVDHPVWGHYEADDEGGFDFPDEMSDELHSFCHRGKRIWENEDERSLRLHGDEVARRRDPQSLYAAVEKIASMAEQFGALRLAEAGGSDDPKPSRARKAPAGT